ncbi:SMI1/KNR4 family protein [Escherichia albertii]|uniref:SMI1/KNR4 family protein n=1 Tax=Escherichia albertii TaxID=208962 RepID=UPI001795603D
MEVNRSVLYEKHIPIGYEFPADFLAILNKIELPDIAPWEFMCESQKYLDAWVGILNKYYPSRKLIPIARWNTSDDVVCFDAMDNGGMKVHFIHAYASAGWEERGVIDSFSAWYEIAKEDSMEHKNQQEDEV